MNSVTSATLVTMVTIIGALAQALANTGNATLTLAATVLAAVYTVCKTLVQMQPQQPAPATLPPFGGMTPAEKTAADVANKAAADAAKVVAVAQAVENAAQVVQAVK